MYCIMYRFPAPQKLARAMVKEYVDAERRHRGEKPCAPQALYRSNPAPDWWPAGCAVSLCPFV
jgi:hypothetical protein